jgi:hypothetical protein
MTMIYDLLIVTMQVAFNRTVYDTEARSDFYILDYSQMVIPFNPLVLCFLLPFTILDILQNVINSISVHYYLLRYLFAELVTYMSFI